MTESLTDANSQANLLNLINASLKTTDEVETDKVEHTAAVEIDKFKSGGRKNKISSISLRLETVDSTLVVGNKALSESNISETSIKDLRSDPSMSIEPASLAIGFLFFIMA